MLAGKKRVAPAGARPTGTRSKKKSVTGPRREAGDTGGYTTPAGDRELALLAPTPAAGRAGVSTVWPASQVALAADRSSKGGAAGAAAAFSEEANRAAAIQAAEDACKAAQEAAAAAIERVEALRSGGHEASRMQALEAQVQATQQSLAGVVARECAGIVGSIRTYRAQCTQLSQTEQHDLTSAVSILQRVHRAMVARWGLDRPE